MYPAASRLSIGRSPREPPPVGLGSRHAAAFRGLAAHALVPTPWCRRPGADDLVPRRQEGYSKDFRPLSLGVIDLPAGPGTLVLRATAIPGKQVADVRRLVLVPVRD